MPPWALTGYGIPSRLTPIKRHSVFFPPTPPPGSTFFFNAIVNVTAGSPTTVQSANSDVTTQNVDEFPSAGNWSNATHFTPYGVPITVRYECIITNLSSSGPYDTYGKVVTSAGFEADTATMHFSGAANESQSAKLSVTMTPAQAGVYMTFSFASVGAGALTAGTHAEFWG